MDQIQRGLVGVKIDTSSICHIDGEKGELIYRGYDIRELADHATFEEVIYLLWHGDLPDRQQLEEFNRRLREFMVVPPELDVLRNLAGKGLRPMNSLRTAVSLMGMNDRESDDYSHDNLYRIGLRLTVQMPALVAAVEIIVSMRPRGCSTR